MSFLFRAIAAQPLVSSYSARKRLLVLYPISFVHHSSRTATTYTTSKCELTPLKSAPQPPPSPSPATSIFGGPEKKDRPRPSEIPYQPKIANSVSLIGHVETKVQFTATEDGNHWAGTIIAQQSSNPNAPPPVWIPVVFEGDLAYIANCHLKVKDYVHIAGELCLDQPSLILSKGRTNVQVMAHSLNFVNAPSKSTKSSIEQAADVSSIQGEKLKASNRSEPISLDQKETFENLQAADVSSFESEMLKYSNSSEHISLDHMETFENLHQKKTLENRHQKKTSHSVKTRKKGNSSVGSWRDLLQDPIQWFDYRESKRDGLVKPEHPDFKHKDSDVGLWLANAPGGVLAGLGGLSFDREPDPWKDLVANPDKWWDNRSGKVSENSPDFKHKESGKVLWLSSSPPWVSSSLPPLEAKQNDASGQDGDSWKDLVENPQLWWDNRSTKLNPKAPDFKHKDTGKVLWLSSAPAWALPGLPRLKGEKTDGGAYEKKRKETDAGAVEGGPWKDLVENPNQWWDQRSKKRNPKAPDFKHKVTAEALWLSSAPSWALGSIPPLKLQETDGGAYQKKETSAGAGADADEGDPWKDLVENPNNWWDNRSKKFSEKQPDFKHRETGKALWVDKVPEWASSRLPPLKAYKS